MPGGSCECGVEPAIEIEGEHGIVGNSPHVDKHILPLSALCLVASDGVAIFHLKGIEKSIFLQRTVAGTLVARQFLLHLHEKLLILLACESRSIGGECIKHHTGIKLHLMVGEIEGYAGKAEALSLLGAVHTRHPCHIAIGTEINFVILLTPEIVVLRHQHLVATAQFLLHI